MEKMWTLGYMVGSGYFVNFACWSGDGRVHLFFFFVFLMKKRCEMLP